MHEFSIESTSGFLGRGKKVRIRIFEVSLVVRKTFSF